MMIEAIASETLLVALRGRAVCEVVVGGAASPINGRPDDPAAGSDPARTLGPANFGVGQACSGYEQVYQEVSSSVTCSDMMMRHALKLVEPQRNRVGRVDQRAAA
jgi:hypothetical protein